MTTLQNADSAPARVASSRPVVAGVGHFPLKIGDHRRDDRRDHTFVEQPFR